MAEKIIFSVEFDALAAQKRIEQITIDLAAAKKAQAELNAERKAGNLTEEAYSKAYYANQKSIRDLNAEQGALIRNTQLAEKANKSQAGSLNALSAQYSLLVHQIRAMSEEERENTEAGKALVAQAHEISETLKEQEKAYGSTGRNVGNYKDSIKEALGELGFFGQATERIKAIQEGFGKAQKAVKDSVVAAKNAVKDARDNFKDATKAFSEAKGATETLTAANGVMKASFISGAGALNVFKLALVGTGIGALVVAFGSLVAFLTSSQKGIDFVSQKLKGLSTVVGFITKELSEFGETIFNAFDNPKQALVDLVNFIGNNLLNRLKAFKVVYDGILNADFNKVNDGLFQMTVGVTDVTGKTKAFVKELNEVRLKGEAIEKENQRIRDSERAINLERSKSKAQIEQLKFISDDTTKSTNERIKAAKEAFALEQKSANAQFKVQEARIANLKKEQALKGKLTEDNDALAEEEMKLAELREGSTTRRIELNNKINSLNAEAEAKRLAAIDKENAYLAEQQRLQKEGAAALLKFYTEQANRELEVEVKKLKDIKRAEDQFYADRIKNVLEKEEEFNLAILQARLDGSVKEYDLQQLQLDNEIKSLEAQRQAAQDHGDSLVAIDKEITEKRIQFKQNETNETVRLEQAKFQALQAITSSLQSLNEIIAGDNAKNTEFGKALALVQIGISAAIAVANAVSSAKGLTGIDYIAQIAPGIAAALAGIAQAKALLSETGDTPTPPKFYEGGEYSPDGGGFTTRGNPHQEATNLGRKPYTYHQNEYIMPNAVLQTEEGSRLAIAAENIRKSIRGNPHIGGRFNGGLVTDGGMSARSITGGVNADDISNIVVSAIKAQKAPVVSVTDINRVNKSVAANQAKATL